MKPQPAKRLAAILILFGCLIVSVILVVGYFFDALPEIGTVVFAFLVLAYPGIIAAVSFVHWPQADSGYWLNSSCGLSKRGLEELSTVTE